MLQMLFGQVPGLKEVRGFSGWAITRCCRLLGKVGWLQPAPVACYVLLVSCCLLAVACWQVTCCLSSCWLPTSVDALLSVHWCLSCHPIPSIAAPHPSTPSWLTLLARCAKSRDAPTLRLWSLQQTRKPACPLAHWTVSSWTRAIKWQ